MTRKKIRNLAICALAATLFAPMAFSEGKNDKETVKDNSEAAVIRNLDIFNSLYKELNTFYVDTLDAKKHIETAINAMLDEIDPYTEYITDDGQDDFMVISTGEYGGIGSYIMQRKTGGVFISGPYAGSPAARAGLKCGDQIIMIDNDSVSTWKSDQVSKRLKGQANTQIKVTVKRPYVADSILSFTFTREKIKLNPVTYYGVTKDNLGYIALNTYNEHSAEGVKKALLEFKANPAVKGVVLDLCGNGGGLVDEAIKILGFFLPKGTEVLTTKGRTTKDFRVYKTPEQPIMPDMPLAVLIDGGSASASEITAGALQDLDRAVIIGSRSFGKGLVQTTRPLPFNSLLKLTIAKYYIPSGRLIQEIDYSQRNPDGTAKHKPDSLCNVFYTAHGREVRDGGGITPDIKVTYPDANRLVYNIVRDQWAFDYATKYAAEHPTIVPAGEFEITDEIFEDFKKFIDPSKFEYDKVCETGVSLLRKTAETEGYMTDSVKTEFEKLEKMLKHDLNHDLDRNRKEISRQLSAEIIKRYYYDAGECENELKFHKAMEDAVAMFNKPGEYERILHLNEKKAKKKK
ncbi:MAG: S41 family peptidase [Bacteroidales bacterium]|nr:S41 family peptidase [Bacteroidales bacterium]